MILFLTSDIGTSKKVNGERIPCEFNNTNNFASRLQKHIKNGKNFVFVASNPTTHEINDYYGKLTFDSFNLSGFNFENLQILDARTQNNAEKLIKNADIVLLAGGHTPTQNKFFQEIELGKLLKAHKPVVIGQSAGSLNMAKNVYCSPEEDDLNQPKYFEGLGLTDINIEPHFDLEAFENNQFLKTLLLEDSKTKPFLAITDGSFVFDDGKNAVIYGEAYWFSNGNLKQVCSNGKTLKFSVTHTKDLNK